VSAKEFASIDDRVNEEDLIREVREDIEEPRRNEL
jgi:hypothetical protein